MNDQNGRPPVFEFLRRNFDEVVILGTLVKLKLGQLQDFEEVDQMVLAALRRSSETFRNADLEATAAILADYDEDQIVGLVSNVKGILHELEFARLENEDGDTILASLYPETTHPGFDVQFQDLTTGTSWPVQLKATNDAGYVRDWVEAHPEGEIRVTEELAGEMGLEGSGLENGELTVRTEEFIDRMLRAADDASIWDYFPGLTAVSVAVALIALWKRHKTHEIDFNEFKRLAIRMTGIKAAKVGGLIFLLTLPGIGFVTAVALVASLLMQVRSFWTRGDLSPEPEPAV